MIARWVVGQSRFLPKQRARWITRHMRVTLVGGETFHRIRDAPAKMKNFPFERVKQVTKKERQVALAGTNFTRIAGATNIPRPRSPGS